MLLCFCLIYRCVFAWSAGAHYFLPTIATTYSTTTTNDRLTFWATFWIETPRKEVFLQSTTTTTLIANNYGLRTAAVRLSYAAAHKQNESHNMPIAGKISRLSNARGTYRLSVNLVAALLTSLHKCKLCSKDQRKQKWRRRRRRRRRTSDLTKIFKQILVKLTVFIGKNTWKECCVLMLTKKCHCGNGRGGESDAKSNRDHAIRG